MYTICLEYKDSTRYFYDVIMVEVIKGYIYIYTDYGLYGRFDLSKIENINIYPDNEDNENEH